RSRTQLRPEKVHRLLAMETMARREREQLQQRRRLASPPGLLGNLPVADAHAESTEQLDAELSQLLTSADDTAPRRGTLQPTPKTSAHPLQLLSGPHGRRLEATRLVPVDDEPPCLDRLLEPA